MYDERHLFYRLLNRPTDYTSLYKQTPCNRLVPQGQQYLPLLTHSLTDLQAAICSLKMKYPHRQSITDKQNCKHISFLDADYLFLAAAAAATA